MNLSLRTLRTSALAQVSRFITWHQRHHQDCSETMTNFFSLAALAKRASLHSFQKPSLLSIGAAWAERANNSGSRRAMRRIMASVPDVSQHVRALCPLEHTGP